MAQALHELGLPEERHPAIFLILDEKDKVPQAALVEMLLGAGMAAPLCARLLEMLQIGSLEQLRASPLGQSAPARQLYKLFAMAKSLDFDRYLVFDFGIVRGLAYYTGVIFEAYDVPRKFRAVFGGGRYDTLFQRLAGTDRPAVGLGFGDVVIGEILAARAGFTAPDLAVDVCVGSFDESLTVEAFRVASQLQQRGVAVDLAVAIDKPRKFFAYASKARHRAGRLRRSRRIQRQAVMLRNMQTREQRGVRDERVGGQCPPPPSSASLTPPLPPGEGWGEGAQMKAGLKRFNARHKPLRIAEDRAFRRESACCSKQHGENLERDGPTARNWSIGRRNFRVCL